MGSSRNLFLLMGILFVLPFLLSSQVASSNGQTTEHIDKKNGKAVHLPNTERSTEKYSGQVGYKPLDPKWTPKCKIYGSCLPPRISPKPRRCNYANMCQRRPPCCGKAQEFTKDQFKDDFHN